MGKGRVWVGVGGRSLDGALDGLANPESGPERRRVERARARVGDRSCLVCVEQRGGESHLGHDEEPDRVQACGARERRRVGRSASQAQRADGLTDRRRHGERVDGQRKAQTAAKKSVLGVDSHRITLSPQTKRANTSSVPRELGHAEAKGAESGGADSRLDGVLGNKDPAALGDEPPKVDRGRLQA